MSERIEFVIGLAIYGGLHAVFLLSPYWAEFLLVWVLPQRIAFFLITYFFARIQHPEDVHWEDAPFQATAQIRSNLLQRIIMLSQTNHHIHHLAPSLPFYRYWRGVEAGQHLFERQNIPERGFFAPADRIVLPSYGANWLEAQVTATRDVATNIREYELKPAGGMDTWMFGAIGEGMSDVLAILANNNDTPSANIPPAIRTAFVADRMAVMPLTSMARSMATLRRTAAFTATARSMPPRCGGFGSCSRPRTPAFPRQPCSIISSRA